MRRQINIAMGEKLRVIAKVSLVLFFVSMIILFLRINDFYHILFTFLMMYFGGGAILLFSRSRSTISHSILTNTFAIIFTLSLSTMFGVGILSMSPFYPYIQSSVEIITRPIYFISMGIAFISAILVFIFRLRDRRELDGSDSLYDNELRRIALITSSRDPSNSMFSPRTAPSLSTTLSDGPLQPINTAIPHKISVISFNDKNLTPSSTSIKKRTDWLCMVCGHVNKGIRTKCSECETQSPRRLNI